MIFGPPSGFQLGAKKLFWVTPLYVRGSESRAHEDSKNWLKLGVTQNMSDLEQFEFSKKSAQNRWFSRVSRRSQRVNRPRPQKLFFWKGLLHTPRGPKNCLSTKNFDRPGLLTRWLRWTYIYVQNRNFRPYLMFWALCIFILSHPSLRLRIWK